MAPTTSSVWDFGTAGIDYTATTASTIDDIVNSANDFRSLYNCTFTADTANGTYGTYATSGATTNTITDTSLYSNTATNGLISTGSSYAVSGYVTIGNDGSFSAQETKWQKFERERQEKLVQFRVRSRANIIRDVPKNEEIAIETLREEILESEFRKYIKYGFILVPGKSGKTYQVFRNRSHTKVWKKGKVVEEVCVRIADDSVPMTDNVIAFKRMIEFDEEEFKKCGNVYRKLA